MSANYSKKNSQRPSRLAIGDWRLCLLLIGNCRLPIGALRARARGRGEIGNRQVANANWRFARVRAVGAAKSAIGKWQTPIGALRACARRRGEIGNRQVANANWRFARVRA
jgi:hypothetical protein